MEETVIKIENLKKKYRLGVIGTGTFAADFQSWWAKVRGKEDPNSRVGTGRSNKSGTFMALNGIDLEIKKGEALGILGANGAGKSTLLKILSRITAPTSGMVFLKGRVTSMLEVGTGFHPEMTGRENIYMNGAILGMSRAQIDARMDEIIAFSEIGEFIDTPVKRYSSGMYVKLAFSVAAHLNSEIMIIDEVLAVGDMNFQTKCIDKMNSIVQDEGRTVLCVSHNIYNIKRLCQHCIVLDAGKIIFDGHVDEAISVYIGNPETAKIHSTYHYNSENVQIRSQEASGRPKLQALDVLRNEIPIDASERLLEFRLQWKAPARPEEYKLRIVVHYIDSTLAGTALSQDFSAERPGEETASTFSLNLQSLAPGGYYFQFDVLDAQEDARARRRVWLTAREKIFFNVVDPAEHSREKNKYLNVAEVDVQEGWNHSSWGHIRLPDANVIGK